MKKKPGLADPTPALPPPTDPTPGTGLAARPAGRAPTLAKRQINDLKELVYEVHKMLLEISKRLDDLEASK
jgi:hypothetical protein